MADLDDSFFSTVGVKLSLDVYRFVGQDLFGFLHHHVVLTDVRDIVRIPIELDDLFLA